MKFLAIRPNLLLLTLSILCTSANQACFASRGDLIAHTVVPQSTVRTYRVVGWQNELTAANPNLGNYYWEPMTKRIINTTKTTSKGATAAPAIVVNRTSHYQKPTHAALPASDVVQLQTNVVFNPSRSKCMAGDTHAITQTVLTYQSYPNSSRSSGPTTAASFAAKESVYGVLKSSHPSR